MKKIFGVLCTGAMCLFIACNSSSSSTDSVDSAQDVNDSLLPDSNDMMSGGDTTSYSSAPVSQEDADWATEVANSGMTEIELSKVAQDKATDPRLKAFASMMVSDHTNASDKLKKMAAAKNITLPASLSDASQKKLDKLNQTAAGKDFDKAYTDDMVDGHKKAVEKFEKGSENLKDSDLKAFASATLPVITIHYDSIKAIAGKK